MNIRKREFKRKKACKSESDESGETLVKSLPQNNLMQSPIGDLISPKGSGAGISDRSLGNIGKPSKPDTTFTDMLRQSVGESRAQSEVKKPDWSSNDQKPSFDVQESLDRRSRDLDEKKIDVQDKAPNKPQSFAKKSDPIGADKDVPEVEGSIPKASSSVEDRSSNELEASSDKVSAKEALRPLKNAVGGKVAADSLIGNNAVLSFVTGRLDRLEPEGIPGIISTSPFIKQAVASPEISDLMTQPMSVADLCQMFEIDDSVLSKAIRGGLDTSMVVAPKDFLASIGVDPGQVSAELSILQQRLPLEGVKPYVEKAKMMAEKVSSVLNQGKAPETKMVDDLSTKGIQTGASQNTSKDQEIDPQLIAATGMVAASPSINKPSAVVSSSDQPKVANQKSLFASKENAKNPGLMEGLGRAIKSPEVSGDSLIESMLFDRANLNVNLADANPLKEVDASIDLSSDLSVEVPVELQLLDSFADPYAQIGLDMKNSNIETKNFAPTNVGLSMDSLSEQLQANGFVLKTSSESKPALSDKLTDMDEGRIEFDVASKDLSQGFIKINQDQVAVPNVESFKGSNSGFFQGSNSDSSDFMNKDDAKSELLTDLRGVSTSQNVQKFEVTTVEHSVETQKPQESALHSKIMQNASLLLKDGGGSMRMDFDSKTLGKIDLAIQLSQNQLDVRILTPNEQARDIINKELSGLRDGLGNQGISLRNVEIGQASQSSQNFAGNQFSNGHNGQQASYNEMKQYAKSFADSFSESSTPRIAIPEVRRMIPQGWNSSKDSSRISVRI